MTTLAALRDALTTAARGDATAHHGPNAARAVAHELAAAGAHSHLAAYGETVCVSGQCGPALDALRGLL